MDADFPAAHSMDTDWFAVDMAGYVALFHSGENGPLPPDADQEDLSISASFPGFPLAEACQDSSAADEALQDFLAYPEDYGLYGFVAEEDSDLPLHPPYVRYIKPDKPLHIDQLPPEARSVIKRVQFRFLFSERKLIQTLDHLRVVIWTEECCGYLSEDGKTIKPVPGYEDQFADWVKLIRQEFPEATANLIFEPTNQPKPKKRSPKRKKETGDGR